MKIRDAKTIIELTSTELETIKEFIRFLHDERSLNLSDTWDIMVSILDDDNEVLEDLGYCLKVVDN